MFQFHPRFPDALAYPGPTVTAPLDRAWHGGGVVARKDSESRGMTTARKSLTQGACIFPFFL